MTVEQLKQAHERKQPFTFDDPIGAHTPLPYKATFFPLGFPVRLQTNSPEVLDCAAESWLGYPHLFSRKPIQVRVLVQESGATECPPRPSLRAQDHILMNVADAQHYSAIDLAQQHVYISTTTAALHHRSYFRYFFLEPAALSPVATRYATAIHAACVEFNGKGVLLCGDSSAGKSTLSYACARSGWTYVTDDASFLIHNRTDRLVVGNFRQVRFRPTAASLFPTLENREVIRRAQVGKPSIELCTASHRELKRAPSARIHHIVFLQRKPVHQPVLRRFPREVARQYILQTSSWLPAFQPQDTTQIDAFLKLPTLELQYQDLDSAVDRLKQLTQEGPR